MQPSKAIEEGRAAIEAATLAVMRVALEMQRYVSMYDKALTCEEKAQVLSLALNFRIAPANPAWEQPLREEIKLGSFG